MWGYAFREWKDAGGRIKAVVWAGVALLLIATVVIGYGNSIAVGSAG
jgi:L-rhamnose-H+ transport protein